MNPDKTNYTMKRFSKYFKDLVKKNIFDTFGIS